MSLQFAGIQHAIVWEDPQANFAHLQPLIASAAEGGAQLIALTEMYSNGFSMNTRAIAEPPNGPSTEFLLEQAAATGAWVAGSLPEQGPGMELPHNCLVVAGPDGTLYRYPKQHRFAYGGEDQHYTAGSNTVSISIEGVRITLLVCFDLRFAPEFWNCALDTDLYLLVANWPASRSMHWTTLLRARAIENLAYVAGINRIGTAADGLEHSGDSRIFGPFGEFLATDTPNTECVLAATIDPDVVAQTRSDFPFLGER